MRSPFTGLRFARIELDNFRAGTMIKIAIIAISLIPLIYGGLFLLAFLDPYGNLANVPAAVVNLDEGAEIQDEQRNIGQELCDELVKNNEERSSGEASGYNWQFVDEATASKGLDDATYYMELIIPENFSKNIASADSDDPESAQLQVYFNPSTNLIAQTVGSSMVTKIKAELTNKIEKEYFDNIFVKIDDAADSLQDAVDGSADLQDGLDKLEDGSSTLTDGLESAASGAQELDTGARSAKDGSATITKNLDKLTTGAKKVDKGVDKLSKNLKKLDTGIADAQADSADLAKVITGVGNALTAFGKSNDAKYLSTATSLAKKVKEANPTIGNDLYTYVDNLTSKLKTCQSATASAAKAEAAMAAKKAAMEEKQEALGAPTVKLKKAAANLKSDLATLGTAGTETENTMSTLNESLTKINAAVQAGAMTSDQALVKINEALSDLDTSSLSAAIKAVVSGETAGSGPEMLLALQDFQTALTDYQTAASEYQKVAGTYQTAAKEQATAGANVSEARGQITGYLMGVKNTSEVASDSTGTVASAVDQLYKAVSGDLASGTSQVASGSSKLEQGSSTLTKGLKTLKSGTNSLVLGLGDAVDGSQKITDGLGTASEGTTELHDGLADGQQEMADSVEDKDSKVDMMSTPVEANGDQGTGECITEVKNYGTGFAPYFIGLGMWVGALMISMVMSVLNRRILMSGASSLAAVIASYIPMWLIGILQAALLLLFIQFGLGMTIKFPLEYYLFGVLTAACFISIIQFFRATLGTTGMVVVVVLLMLQLCTAAGTFPIEAELPIFNVLNPWLPMTYVVGGFRMAMAGLSLEYFWPDVVALLIFTAMFFCFTLLWARHRRRVTMSQLYPPIQLAH